MATWMWMEGITNPPENGGWFQLQSYSLARSDAVYNAPVVNNFSANLVDDVYSRRILELCVRGTPVPRVVVFIDPQLEITHCGCVVSSCQTDPKARTPIIHFAVDFESMGNRWCGTP